MLQNAYFVAKFGFHTAENEPSKFWFKKLQTLKFCKTADPRASRALSVRLSEVSEELAAAQKANVTAVPWVGGRGSVCVAPV